MTRLPLVVLASLVALAAAQTCQIIVPPNALTPVGLATPYCTRFNATSLAGCEITAANNFVALAFVHGVILDTSTGAVSVYNPLVINCNTTAAIQPTKPILPANSVVALWFGYNGGTLLLTDTPGTTSLAQSNCVGGVTINGTFDNFVQFGYCNAIAWFEAAKNLIMAGKLTVLPLGNAVDGKLCPNIRSWDLIDQDQSDNVPTQYLVDGTTALLAQFSAANMAALNTPTIVANPSDNIVATSFMMPAVGCSTSVWKVPNLADNGALVAAQPLNEIQAHYFASAPQALVPFNHAFTLTNTINAGTMNAAKTNAYRVAVFQPKVSTTLVAGGTGQGSPTFYCKQLNTVGGPRIFTFKTQLLNAASPAGGGQTLYAFLTARFAASNNNLGCMNLIGSANIYTTF